MSKKLTLGTIIFTLDKWDDKVKNWIKAKRKERDNPFLDANAEMISKILRAEDASPNVVVNISADALLRFVKEGRYKNIYELQTKAGEDRKASPTRNEVDALLNLPMPKDQYYFGAIELGGTGVRFYGEYCMVINRRIINKHSRLLDRNSYDLTRAPFKCLDHADKKFLVQCLTGEMDSLVPMIVSKILPQIEAHQYLITAGRISDLILHDEEYVEVQKHSSFGPDDIEEVRIAPEEEAIQSRIVTNFERGILPTPAELIWSNRRFIVEQQLKSNKISTRVVSSNGRGNRWR